jgi:hypothetical protein
VSRPKYIKDPRKELAWLAKQIREEGGIDPVRIGEGDMGDIGKRCEVCGDLVSQHRILLAKPEKHDSPALIARKLRIQKAHQEAGDQPEGLAFDVQLIQDRIDAIRDIADSRDYEAAHAEADRLYRDAMTLIRDGKFTNPAAIATATLLVETVVFPRHNA